jgi:hypothetical protein
MIVRAGLGKGAGQLIATGGNDTITSMDGAASRTHSKDVNQPQMTLGNICVGVEFRQQAGQVLGFTAHSVQGA